MRLGANQFAPAGAHSALVATQSDLTLPNSRPGGRKARAPNANFPPYYLPACANTLLSRLCKLSVNCTFNMALQFGFY